MASFITELDSKRSRISRPYSEVSKKEVPTIFASKRQKIGPKQQADVINPQNLQSNALNLQRLPHDSFSDSRPSRSSSVGPPTKKCFLKRGSTLGKNRHKSPDVLDVTTSSLHDAFRASEETSDQLEQSSFLNPDVEVKSRTALLDIKRKRVLAFRGTNKVASAKGRSSQDETIRAAKCSWDPKHHHHVAFYPKLKENVKSGNSSIPVSSFLIQDPPKPVTKEDSCLTDSLRNACSNGNILPDFGRSIFSLKKSQHEDSVDSEAILVQNNSNQSNLNHNGLTRSPNVIIPIIESPLLGPRKDEAQARGAVCQASPYDDDGGANSSAEERQKAETDFELKPLEQPSANSSERTVKNSIDSRAKERGVTLNTEEAENGHQPSSRDRACRKGHNLPPLRCSYLGMVLSRGIREANLLVAKKNYFRFYQDCPHGARVSSLSRKAIIQFILEVGRGIASPVSDYSIHMAINLFDRYVSHVGQLTDEKDLRERVAKELEAVGAACLFICSKLEDAWTLSLSDICKTFDNGSEDRKNDILFWELEIAKRLGFSLYSPTLFDFLYTIVDLALPFFDSVHSNDSCRPESGYRKPPSRAKKRSHGSDNTVDGVAYEVESDIRQSEKVSKRNKALAYRRSSSCSKTEYSASSCDSCDDSPIESWSPASETKKNIHFKNSKFIWLNSPNNTRFLSHTSPSFFLERDGFKRNSTGCQILAKAASIGEMAILHPTSIGIPSHLLAAASLIVAMKQKKGSKQKHAEFIPDPIKSFLGRDRNKLNIAVDIVSLIMDECNAVRGASTPEVNTELSSDKHQTQTKLAHENASTATSTMPDFLMSEI